MLQPLVQLLDSGEGRHITKANWVQFLDIQTRSLSARCWSRARSGGASPGLPPQHTYTHAQYALKLQNQVLVGKVLEQGLMEVLQEEELAAMRAHQVCMLANAYIGWCGRCSCFPERQGVSGAKGGYHGHARDQFWRVHACTQVVTSSPPPPRTHTHVRAHARIHTLTCAHAHTALARPTLSLCARRSWSRRSAWRRRSGARWRSASGGCGR